jgi:hypothetical protein
MMRILFHDCQDLSDLIRTASSGLPRSHKNRVMHCHFNRYGDTT